MKRISILALLTLAHLAGQTSPVGLLVTQISGITSSWAGECGANTVDNRSAYLRQNIYHSIAAQGTGSWSVTIQYSNISCSGSWTSYGSTATINQASSVPIAYANDPPFSPAEFINIAITGNATVTYTAQRQLFLANSVGNQTITVSSDCTGSGATSISLICTKTNGTAFGALATAGYPSAGVVKSSGSAFSDSASSDIVSLFSGCSGTQYLGADGNCHSVTGTGSNTLCVDASGSSTTYTCPSPTPAPTTLAGLIVAFIPQTTSTGSSQTLNVAGLGAKNLVWVDGSTALQAGLLVASQMYIFQYDGTSFRLTTAGGLSSPGPFKLSGATSGTPSTPSSGVSCAFSTTTPNTIVCVDASGNVTQLEQLVATGSISLATNSISSAACQTVTSGSVNSVAATGVVSTDVVSFTPNGSIKAVTGFVPGTSGGLTVNAYPSSGYVNFDVCNWSSGSITPGAVTLNYQVRR
jgi:hypothetical protein